MITFFSHPRPFEGEFADIQHMAIVSWLSHDKYPEPIEVILCGRDAVQAAQEYGIAHVDLSCYNEHGTALISDMFDKVHKIARGDILVEISADIVLSVLDTKLWARLRELERPFGVGRRLDVEPGSEVGEWHKPAALDYFVYKAGTIGPIPPFAIGRTAYDNWLLWAALHKWDMQTVDITEAVLPIHVNHGYPEYGNREKMVQSEERAANLRIANLTGCYNWPGVEQTEYIYSSGRIVKRRGSK